MAGVPLPPLPRGSSATLSPEIGPNRRNVVGRSFSLPVKVSSGESGNEALGDQRLPDRRSEETGLEQQTERPRRRERRRCPASSWNGLIRDTFAGTPFPPFSRAHVRS